MQRPFSFNRVVDVPFDALVHMLRDEPEVLIGMARDSALTLADDHSRSGHMMTPSPRVEHDVHLAFGDVHQIDPRCVNIDVRWSAVDGAPWFPTVEGEIEVADLSHATPRCEVSFFGMYTPRLGAVGSLADAIAGHSMVEETLEGFLEAVCGHMMATAVEEGAVAG